MFGFRRSGHIWYEVPEKGINHKTEKCYQLFSQLVEIYLNKTLLKIYSYLVEGLGINLDTLGLAELTNATKLWKINIRLVWGVTLGQDASSLSPSLTTVITTLSAAISSHAAQENGALPNHMSILPGDTGHDNHMINFLQYIIKSFCLKT